MPRRNWLEVVIVVVTGAGERRSFDMPNLRAKKAVTTEMIWLNHQDFILQHLQYAEYIWGVDLVHGREVKGVWKDFVIVGSQLFQNTLRLVSPQGDVVLNTIVEALDQIWKSTKDQRFTDNARMLIYTDQGQLHYDYIGVDPNFRAIPNKLGVAWLKGGKDRSDDVTYLKNLPMDVAFVFPQAPAYVTAHELGHVVADLPDLDDPTNLMGPAAAGNKELDNPQKKQFAASHYIQKGPRPKQGYRPDLPKYEKIL